ncbi:MAG: glycoside hydrolase family 1 protein [Anaerolineae bacterium]|nr:glycoside hydrolase family 1 protein [Anaerolineae bacterium]
MSTRQLEFPKNFLWGAATAAHQNEGNNSNNDFWAWEQISGHVADNTTSGLACDWWHRAEEDFDRAATLHLNTLRLSVEWSRLEPEPNKWAHAAFDRYREMLQALHQRGITPMLTLHHFTNPLWLAEQGGWANPNIVNYFARYARQVVSSLGDLCQLWCTINEPNIYAAYAYVLGEWSPGEQNIFTAFRVMRHQVQAHAVAYHTIKQVQPQAQVGLVQHLAIFDPANPDSIFNRIVASARSTMINWRIVEATMEGRLKFPLGWGKRHVNLANTNDYLGLNYYGRHLLNFNPRALGALFAEAGTASPEMAWPQPWTDREIYPQGLYKLLVELHHQYRKPIFVTENGMADATDDIRPGFILTHLAAVHRALQAGVDVRGYYYWTLVDNYEWVEGWTTPFGLIGLDPQTQRRTIRRSAQLYAEIVEANAITAAMVARYAPAVMLQVFG